MIPPIRLTRDAHRLLLNQAARSWALAAVRALRPALTPQEQRRSERTAATWATILDALGADIPAIDRAAFVKPGPFGGEVWDWKGADNERGRLVNEICRPQVAAAHRAGKLAAVK